MSTTAPRPGGPVAWMAQHSIAANLLMILVLVFVGWFSVSSLYFMAFSSSSLAM